MHFIFIPRLQSGTEERRSGWAKRKANKQQKISTLASCHSRKKKKKKKKKKKVEKAGGHFAECACFCCDNQEKIAQEKQIVRGIFCVLWILVARLCHEPKVRAVSGTRCGGKNQGGGGRRGREGAAGLVSLLWFLKCFYSWFKFMLSCKGTHFFGVLLLLYLGSGQSSL